MRLGYDCLPRSPHSTIGGCLKCHIPVNSSRSFAVYIGAGGIFLPNTPNSLVELGKNEKAKEVLRRVRGTPNVDTEYQSIVVANKVMENMENPWRAIIRYV